MQTQARVQPERSRFQAVIDHLRESRASMQAAAQQLSNLVFDLQKAEDFVHRFETSLCKTIEDNGGEVNVEEQIKQFIQPKYRRPEVVNAEIPQGGSQSN